MEKLDKKNAIISEYECNKEKYVKLCEKIETTIKDLIEVNGIKYYMVTSRVKDIPSLSKKIDIKGERYKSIEDITDIVGVRIITYYSNDVDIAAKIIEEEFEVDTENSIDKRKIIEPDKFGYLSLHFVATLSARRVALPEYSQYSKMKFEIQIRSILQHTWAEIEHDIGYKSAIEVPREIRREFSIVAGLLELADKEFIEIRNKLESYSNKIELELKQKALFDQPIPLDTVSLMAFLNNNEEIKKLNSEIYSITGAAEYDEQSYYIIRKTLNRLSWLNIHNINELENMVHINTNLAISIAKIFLKDNNDKVLFNTTGIFYACYAELLIKNYSLEKIHYYFFNYIDGDPEEVLFMANKLFESYEIIKRKDQ